MLRERLFLVLTISLLLSARPCSATLAVIAQPDAGYLAHTRLISIGVPDFSLISSLSDGSQIVTFSTAMEARTVPTTWLTWGSPPDTESDTPRVLWTGADVESVTLNFALPSQLIGFEAEPGFLGIRTIVVNFFDDAISLATLTLDVDGFAGAILFAAEDNSAAFTRVTIESDADFAIAQIRYAQSVPEPNTLWLLAVAFFGAFRQCTRMSKRGP
jgi:hypothetical protein